MHMAGTTKTSAEWSSISCRDTGNIMVEAPDGVIYGCHPDYVYVPEPLSPRPSSCPRHTLFRSCAASKLLESGYVQTCGGIAGNHRSRGGCGRGSHGDG